MTTSDLSYNRYNNVKNDNGHFIVTGRNYSNIRSIEAPRGTCTRGQQIVNDIVNFATWTGIIAGIAGALYAFWTMGGAGLLNGLVK